MGTIITSAGPAFYRLLTQASDRNQAPDGPEPFPMKTQPAVLLHLSQTIRNATRTMPFTLLSDDELIARLLIHTWTLTTGKTLRGDVPPHELSDEELIDFWSDDRLKQTPVSPPSRPRDGGEERAAEDGER